MIVTIFKNVLLLYSMPRKIKEKSENDTKSKRVKKVKSSVLKDKVIIKYEPTELVIEWPKNL